MANQERIICAAMWHKSRVFESTYLPNNIDSGVVVCGYRHDRCIGQLHDMGMEMKDELMVQGFLTTEERFVDRKLAADIAFEAGQMKENVVTLFSEDLY